jgi:hypothetical protein
MGSSPDHPCVAGLVYTLGSFRFFVVVILAAHDAWKTIVDPVVKTRKA